MWKVYVHINQINGKAYVGITSRKLEQRWGYNGLGYKPDKDDNQNRHFWNAICKYGWDSFSHELIEENLTEDEANELEVYYIEQFDSFYNGYNSTLGGGGTLGMHHSEDTKRRMAEKRKGKRHSKEWCEHIRESQISKRPVICLETGETFPSPRDCSETLNLSLVELLAVCRGAGLSLKGFHFQYADEPLKTVVEIESLRKKSSQIRKVVCIETEEEYESISECAKKTGINRRNIQRACKIYTSAKGLHYKFADDDTTLEDILERNKRKITRKIHCIENDMVFDSLDECALFFGVKSKGNISSVCSGKQKTLKGYHLEYWSDEDKRVKRVMCIEDGKIYETQKQCADFYGMSTATMCGLCNNTIESYNGLHFIYVDYEPPQPVRGRKSKTKKVRCLETGIEFQSKAECAKEMNISPSNLSAVLNNRGRKSACGYHFEYVDE